MATEPTTRFASMLTDTTTRREALRFLAGIALGTSGLPGLGAADTDAKNKKKSKGKGKGKGKDKGKGKATCDRRKPLARVQVSHDGSISYTPTLENGRRYRLRVSNHVIGTAPLFSPVGIDAGYIFSQHNGQTVANDLWNEVDYGLSVDGGAASWGGYNANHVYERNVVGQGERLALRLITGPDSGLNQSAQGELAAGRIISTPVDFEFSGALSVEIFCD